MGPRLLAGRISGSCSFHSGPRNQHLTGGTLQPTSCLFLSPIQSLRTTMPSFRSSIVPKVKISRRLEPSHIKSASYIRRLQGSESLIHNMVSTNPEQSFGGQQEFTQALIIFLNHYSKSTTSLGTIGSSESSSLNQNAATGDIGSGLEFIRGFFSSLRVATCRIIVIMNVSRGAFYHAGPLPALLNSYGVGKTGALEKFLRLVRVQTPHLPVKRNKANEVIPRVKTIFWASGEGEWTPHGPPTLTAWGGAKDVGLRVDDETSSSSAPKVESKGGAKGKAKGEGKAHAGS